MQSPSLSNKKTFTDSQRDQITTNDEKHYQPAKNLWLTRRTETAITEIQKTNFREMEFHLDAEKYKKLKMKGNN